MYMYESSRTGPGPHPKFKRIMYNTVQSHLFSIYIEFSYRARGKLKWGDEGSNTNRSHVQIKF